MEIIALIVGIVLIGSVLLDAFETIVLPRTVRRAFRLTSTYFWAMSVAYGLFGRTRHNPRRQLILNMFAPMMLIALIALWAIAMIFGFGLVLWGIGTPLNSGEGPVSLGSVFYFSGVTFFTLGFGDIVPSGGASRVLAVTEAGVGFGFLALIIAYIPVIYAAFSRREVQILLLDSKAGSEPTATEMLRRHGEARVFRQLQELLKEWERFSAELLESYLSYPVLSYYRSQHDEQNWLKSLTAIMDTCTLIEVGFEGTNEWEAALKFQAKATFTMARHVVVDLAYILDAAPLTTSPNRLGPLDTQAVFGVLDSVGLRIQRTQEAQATLEATRALYEPFVEGLARELIMDLPRWVSLDHIKDNWETTAWDGARHF